MAWRTCLTSFLAAAAAASSALAQVPAAPLVDAVRSGTDVRLEWAALPDATGYHIYRTADLSQAFVEIGQVPASPFLDLGAVPGPPDRFYYQVRGENGSGLGAPSNMAFKANVTVDCAALACAVSLPYRFWPTDVVGAPATSKDLCARFPGVATIRKWVDRGDGCHAVKVQVCTARITVFDHSQAEGYLVTTSSGSPATLDIVGAHDPAFAPGGPASVPIVPCATCSTTESNLVSVPYHAQALRASGLCNELAAAGLPVFAVADGVPYNVPPVHYCGSTYRDFDLVNGHGYFILATSAARWQPVVR